MSTNDNISIFALAMAHHKWNASFATAAKKNKKQLNKKSLRGNNN